ncbi:hypothetical protein EON65_32895 [archaeon]|nr:MAG: hypothetical protein EON65_32895 [archaeon]
MLEFSTGDDVDILSECVYHAGKVIQVTNHKGTKVNQPPNFLLVFSLYTLMYDMLVSRRATECITWAGTSPSTRP